MATPLMVGVMGGGTAAPKDWQTAYHLGRLVALEGWILLNGGRKRRYHGGFGPRGLPRRGG